jgi:hypothetical protein
MLIKSTHAACAALLLILWVPGHAAGGVSVTQGVFEPIPVPLRRSLTRRLKLLVEYHRSMRWGDLYGLLSSEERRGRSKEEFVRQMGVHTYYLTRFVPKRVNARRGAGGGWTIRGCAKLSGLKSDVDAVTVAVCEGGEWHFWVIAAQKPQDAAHSLCGKNGR